MFPHWQIQRACWADHAAWCFGIEDDTHAVVGTRFDPAAAVAKGNQLLPLWLSLHLQPNIGHEIHPFEYQGQRVVMFEIHPAAAPSNSTAPPISAMAPAKPN